jgi:hypothetical protein
MLKCCTNMLDLNNHQAKAASLAGSRWPAATRPVLKPMNACPNVAGTAAREIPAADATAAPTAVGPEDVSVQGAATAAAAEQHEDLPLLTSTATTQAAAPALDNEGFLVPASDFASEVVAS